MSGSYPEVVVESRAQWRAWLSAHHADSPGIWLVTWKAATGRPRITAAEITDEALCFGWVDSRPRAVDGERRAILVTPRTPTGRWSRINKERAARLTDDGRMTDAGLRAVRIAQANGAWTALDVVEDLTEPDDLAAALDADPGARTHWDAFRRSTRRAILEWITAAKRPATRADRIATTVAEAAVNRRANQWRQPKSAALAADER
jgi:uncharacterized protein YdeI (YjbR/CyaY-like superfamily)